MAEDDGGGIAGFECDLVGAFHDGDAVGNERVAQDVPRPRDAEGFREGGDFLVLGAGRNDPAAAGQRSEPRCEIVADGDDAAGGRLRLSGPHLDDAPVEVDGGPVESGDFCAPDPSEGTDGKERDQSGWCGVNDPGEVVGNAGKTGVTSNDNEPAKSGNGGPGPGSPVGESFPGNTGSGEAGGNKGDG